ncbi:hypothetical protein [Polaromonas glacialis]|uniref:hypothetical protein n=1 Tax=Polaromonas glacialis TaxID=866564 RepID=UPI0012EB0C6A|nr:hypothetical protein [Polaromonas glacialis]
MPFDPRAAKLLADGCAYYSRRISGPAFGGGQAYTQLNLPLHVGGMLGAANHAGPLAVDVADRCVEQAPDFVKARRAHSAVESAVNGLEVHGLEVCRVKGYARLDAPAFRGFALKKPGGLPSVASGANCRFSLAIAAHRRVAALARASALAAVYALRCTPLATRSPDTLRLTRH